MNFEVVNLSSQKDKDQAYQLWELVFDDIWPVDKQNFDEVVFSQNSNNFIIKDGSKIIGHLSVQMNGESAAIVSILVEKIYQRKGAGTKLINVAKEELKQKGIKRISLGSGGNSYFWPGVPTNLEVAVSFFKKMGWMYSEISVDMVGKLTDYQTQTGIFQRIEDLGIRLEFAKKDQFEKLDKFEQENFPDWYSYFSETIKKDRLDDILLAVSADSQILGSVLIDRNKRVWNRILGNKVGALGALGVSEKARGQGVGLALAARGTEILKESGVEICFLGWTWLVDWYGKLGYKVWREYQMSTKNI